MKFNFSLIAILWLLIASSCSISEKEPSSILLKGTLHENETGYHYLIKSGDSQGYKNFYRSLDSCWIDSTGQFEFSLDAKAAGLYQIRKPEGFNAFYSMNLYLEPGDTLIVTQTEKDVSFKGNSSEINTLQIDLRKSLFQEDSSTTSYKDRRYLEPTEFSFFLNELKKDREKVIEEFSKSNILPAKFRNYLLAKIHCQWSKDSWDYLEYHSYYAHGEWAYLSIDSLDYNLVESWQPDSSFNFLVDYKLCVAGYLDYMYNAKTKSLSDSAKWLTTLEDKFAIIKENFSGINRDIALSSLSDDFWMYSTLMQEDFYKEVKPIKEYFDDKKESEKHHDIFSKNYDAFLKIAPGEPAPNITLPDSSGNAVSLNDFKGKIVYIDFWGTWCGPCVQAIPKHKDLQEKFKNTDDVVFLCIALEYGDEDIQRWKNFLAKKDWPGIHLVANKQFHNSELKPYKLNAAPTYTLIDKDGKIVSSRANGPKNVYPQISDLLSSEKKADANQ